MLYLTALIRFHLYLHMLRYLLIFSCCLLCFSSLQAQTVFSGRIFENKTRITLRGVIIQNLTNKLRAISDESGRFSIAAKVGDLLVLKQFAYQPDTLLLTDMHSREIFMEPQRTVLNQVTVTDSSTHTAAAAKNMILPYDPEFHGQTIVYHRDEKQQYDGGIIIRLHYFKGDERKKKEAQKKEEERILSNEISTIFTADNISHYLPLSGKDLDNFLLLYTPTFKEYNKKEFNLLAYLDTSYKAWQNLSPEERKAGQIFKKQ